MSDERYGYGAECTWHGPLTFARLDVRGSASDGATELYVCPRCGEPLKTTTAEEFRRLAASAEHESPGHEAMLSWSQGKCFPDFETMQNAYRQAMEE